MSSEDLREIPIFFILGRPRSGTSLLSTIFNAHPNVKIAPEYPVMMFLYRKFRKVKYWDEATIRSFAEHAFYHSKNSKISERRVNYLRIDKEFFINELLKYQGNVPIEVFLKSINFYAYSLYEKGETLWIGDKNPVYSLFARRFKKIFPEGKFICIIRDYRDQFVSMKRLAEKDLAIEAPSVVIQVARWKYFTRMFLDLKKRFPERFYILKYEDLVTDQEKTFSSLCDFLKIPYDPSVFEYYKKKDETIKTYSSPNWENFHENLVKPIHTGRIDTWKEKMTEREIRIADQIAGSFADKTGYKRMTGKWSPGIFLKTIPLRTYNYILLTIMLVGSRMPFKVSQWWFLKSLILLKTYLRLKGKKTEISKSRHSKNSLS